MKRKKIIICSVATMMLLSNSGISQRGRVPQRHSPPRSAMPTQRFPHKPHTPRPPMRPGPSNIGRPHRPPTRPQPLYPPPIYHNRYHFHTPIFHSRVSNWVPIGTFLGTVAAATLTTAIASSIAATLPQPVYYNDGMFYQQQNGGYITIAPPIGYSVVSLPPNGTTTECNGTFYYYFNGTFYQKNMDRYIVVAPPIGCIVNNLPSDSQEISENGITYYYYNGTYYQPVLENNMPAYQVIQYSE